MERTCMITLTLLLVMAASVLTGCDTGNDPVTETPVITEPNQDEPDNGGGSENENNDNTDNSDENNMNTNITIRVGGSSFTATLEDNPTGHAFARMLPMTVTMNELNGNEKYFYLSENLPTDSYRPGTIRNGDIMLYGANCIVLFYETFSSSYSYTRIGQLDNPSGLASALGNGDVIITFEINRN